MDERSPIPPNWGFTELLIDRELLKAGKVGLARATGVFPDGTPFQMPEIEGLPAPLEVIPELSGQIVCLTRSLRSGQVRLEVRPTMASDITLEFCDIPLARVAAVSADRVVALDEQFIPPVLRIAASPVLITFAQELHGLLHQRGDALAGRVSATGRAGAAEITDFLMLQATNRHEPMAKQLSTDGLMHPKDLYLYCITVAGEWATFTSTSKRPVAFPLYSHERLRETFVPVIAALRGAFSVVLGQSAVAIPIEPKKYGLSVAMVTDRTLLGTAGFVLAVRSDMPSEELRKRIPEQLKIGPVEKIRELVNLQLPGIALQAIAVAPRQLPHEAGVQYFELDQSGDLWGELKVSGRIALHAGDELPGLRMELWANRAPEAATVTAVPAGPAMSSPPSRESSTIDHPFADTLFGDPNTDPLKLLGLETASAVAPPPRAANRAPGAASPTGFSAQPQSAESAPPLRRGANIYDKLQGQRRPRTLVPPTHSSALENLIRDDHGARAPTASRIQMTVFGPSQVRRRKPFFLQTIFHVVGADEKALALARIVEPQPAIAQALPLPVKVRDGEIITVRLLSDSRVSVDESKQTLQWRGDTVAAQFSIELPWIDWRNEYLFTVEVDVAGCPVGRCKFRIAVDHGRTENASKHVYGSLSRYHRVFLSYASEDAAVVADLAQLIEIQGMEYFLDKLSLRSGSAWQTELEKHIQNSDLFLLCWSRHAATSEWVAKEIEWALRTQRQTGGQPDIRPFVLDGPPIARPPRALRHLHFNSATRFLKLSVLERTEPK
jgi:type VI secretion system protein ImpJ